MTVTQYRFALEFRTGTGQVLGQRPVDPVWEPAVEWARLAWWRASRSPVVACPTDATIEPMAHETDGLPLATGIRIKLAGDGQPHFSGELPFTYFATQARAISRELVTEGLLESGQTYRYRLMAYPRRPAAGATAPPLFSVDEIATVPPFKPVAIDALAGTAEPFGKLTNGDMPVFMPHHILEEASELTERAGGIETGGILIGHLGRDEDMPEIGAIVTAQIPARHTEGEAHKLTFTSQTWAAVQAAISLRRSDEIMLGWWHSHPSKYWCSVACAPEKRRTCPLMHNFFSQDDQCLHETVFARAFQIALVVTNTDAGMQHALFGWRQAAIRQRGFHLLGSNRSWQPAEAILHSETTHAEPCR